MKKYLFLALFLGGVVFGADVTIKYGANTAQVSPDGSLKTSAVINTGTLTVQVGTGSTILVDEQNHKVDITPYKEMLVTERTIYPIQLETTLSAGGSATLTFNNAGNPCVWVGFCVSSFEGADIDKPGGMATFKLKENLTASNFYAITTPTNPVDRFAIPGGGIMVMTGSQLSAVVYNAETVTQNFKVIFIVRRTQD